MQETPTVQQPAPEPQPPIYPPHPYQEYAAVEQPPPAPQPPTYPPHPYREYAAVEQSYYGQPYYGPPVPPPKKKMGTGTKWLIGILVFLVIVLGAGTLAYISTIATSSVYQATPATTQPPIAGTPKSQPTLSAEDNYKLSATTITIAQLVASGDQYKGKVIHITGIVQYSLVTDKGTSGMIILDPGATGKYVVAVFPDGTKMNVFQPGDNIHLWGLCLGTTVSGGETYSGMGAVYWTDTTSGITK